MRYLLIAILFTATTAKSQTSVIQFREVLIRYSNTVTPQPLCYNNSCSYVFRNGNGDTLGIVYERGVVDFRATTNIKDTLSRLTILEPQATLAATRNIFNGITVVSFNPANYYTRTTDYGLPIRIYRVSDNALYCEISEGITWWRLPMPNPTSAASSQLRRFTLP
jgi:hypothetical protein